jgi:hypothetical protein
MPWFRLNDKAHTSPKLRWIGKPARGGLVMLWSYAAFEMTDGWLPDYIVEQELTRSEIHACLTVRMSGRAGLLHAFGETCDCLTDRTWTDDMGGYWIHDFVAGGNPSRAEHDVRRAKKLELNDRDLMHAVRERDGNACRYCGRIVSWSDRRSKYRLTFDHIDPTRAFGVDNIVVCCQTCNQRKAGVKTPEAAGMALLAAPACRPPRGGWSPKTKRPIKRGPGVNLAQNLTQTRRKPAGNNTDNDEIAQVIHLPKGARDQAKRRTDGKPVSQAQVDADLKVSVAGRVGSGKELNPAGTEDRHQMSIEDMIGDTS